MLQAASAYEQARERTEGRQLLQLSEQCAAEGVMCDRHQPGMDQPLEQEYPGDGGVQETA